MGCDLERVFSTLTHGTIMATYEGSCFFGEVRVEVDGEPDEMVSVIVRYAEPGLHRL